MTEAIVDAVKSGDHLLVQAGTGTGKSLAYLAPALTVDGPVVISTATLALQAQLVEKDLPRLSAAVAPIIGREPTFALLKGRHHYVCLAKLETRRRGRPRRRAFRANQVAGRGGQARQADRADPRVGDDDRDRRPRRARSGRRRHRVAGGLHPGAGVRWRDALPLRAGVLRRAVARARPRGRHRGDQPFPALGRHARRAPHRPAAQAAHRRRGARAGRPRLQRGSGRADTVRSGQHGPRSQAAHRF